MSRERGDNLQRRASMSGVASSAITRPRLAAMKRAHILPPVPFPVGGTSGRQERAARTPAGHPASLGRTLSQRAEPRGAPSDMLTDHRARQPASPICAEWRRSCCSEIGFACARACPAPSPRLGPFSCASAARSLLSGNDQARERAARTRGWLAAASLHAPCVALRELPARSDAPGAYAACPTGRACFLRPICCDFQPFGSSMSPLPACEHIARR